MDGIAGSSYVFPCGLRVCQQRLAFGLRREILPGKRERRFREQREAHLCVRTPQPISHMAISMPKSFRNLEQVRTKLERHFKDMQDFEFTIENGRLFILQTRNGKRTGLAAVRIAVEMQRERLMNQKAALLKIPAESIDSLLVPVFDPKALKAATLIAQGLPAGPGAATGRIAFTAATAEIETRKGNKVVLCRTETSPDDLKGMLHSQGILTSRGGVSSHAALVLHLHLQAMPHSTTLQTAWHGPASTARSDRPAGRLHVHP